MTPIYIENKEIFTGKVCKRCLMDESDPMIQFDGRGYCNHCINYERKAKQWIIPGEKGKKILEQKIKEIKDQRKKNRYDVILGISGGVDSSYLAYLAARYELRCLLIHFDNGWNTEIANQNIRNIINKTGFDFYTLVVNWDEFKDLQRSYFNAHVIDIEAITDHAILATMFRLADKNKIKYILSGFNIATEGILPNSWTHRKQDSWNIKDIHKKFGKISLRTYPFYGFWDKRWYNSIMKYQKLEPLNWVDYNKEKAKETLKEFFDWKDYGGKHHESFFTRFYQTVILPEKFGVDKRKAHLSTLIMSGQMSREEAIKILENPVIDPQTRKQDLQYVASKLDFSKDELENYLQKPKISHSYYAIEPLSIRDYFKLLLQGKKVYS